MTYACRHCGIIYDPMRNHAVTINECWPCNQARLREIMAGEPELFEGWSQRIPTRQEILGCVNCGKSDHRCKTNYAWESSYCCDECEHVGIES